MKNREDILLNTDSLNANTSENGLKELPAIYRGQRSASYFYQGKHKYLWFQFFESSVTFHLISIVISMVPALTYGLNLFNIIPCPPYPRNTDFSTKIIGQGAGRTWQQKEQKRDMHQFLRQNKLPDHPRKPESEQEQPMIHDSPQIALQWFSGSS